MRLVSQSMRMLEIRLEAGEPTLGVGLELLDEVHFGGRLVLEDGVHDEVQRVVVHGQVVEQVVLAGAQDFDDGGARGQVEAEDLLQVLVLRHDVGDHPELLELVAVDLERVEEVPVVLADELLVLVNAQEGEVHVGEPGWSAHPWRRTSK